MNRQHAPSQGPCSENVSTIITTVKRWCQLNTSEVTCRCHYGLLGSFAHTVARRNHCLVCMQHMLEWLYVWMPLW